MRNYKIASLIMIIHGVFMEVGGAFCFMIAMFLGNDIFDIEKYFSFKLTYFQDNLNMIIVAGAIYGVVRTIGAIGLLKNKMWGFMLSVINCIITMILMLFLLPAGIMDGVFASSALILMLTQYYGNKKIENN